MDELIIKYLKGEISLEDQHRLSKKLERGEVSPTVLKKLELFWNDPGRKYLKEQDEVHKRIEKKLSSLDNSNGLSNQRTGKSLSLPLARFSWLAAAISLLLVSWFVLRDVRPQPETTVQNIESRSTSAGQKLLVHLSDGTQVRLNAESSIEFPKFFTDSSRVVSLAGEAFFEVEEDPTRPFRVVVGESVIEALGTSFSIRREAGTTNVFLTSGKVSVTSSKVEDAVILEPGEMVAETHGILGGVTHFPYKEIAWNDNVLIFDDASSHEVFHQLEKWYGVMFHFESELDKWYFTGRFDNESLKEVLLSVSHAEDFDFRISNKEVIIKKKVMKQENP